MVANVDNCNSASFYTLRNTLKTSNQTETDSFSSVKNSTLRRIEDTYEPSYAFDETGTEFYTEHWNDPSCDSFRRISSLESFTYSLKSIIADDYKKQNPTSSIHSGGREYLDSIDYGKENEEYINSIDYEKEYEEYKQSRGCTTDEELKLLNSAIGFQTKNSFIMMASMLISSTGGDRYSPFAAQIAESANFSDLVDFWNNSHKANGTQADCQAALDTFMQKINQSEPTQEEQEKANIQRYNSSLISKYTS